MMSKRILATAFVIFSLIALYQCDSQQSDRGSKNTASQPRSQARPAERPDQTSLSSVKANSILSKQKSLNEILTRKAAELVAADRMDEVPALYKERWAILTRLRADIVYDKDLTQSDKDIVGAARQRLFSCGK